MSLITLLELFGKLIGTRAITWKIMHLECMCYFFKLYLSNLMCFFKFSETIISNYLMYFIYVYFYMEIIP